MADGSDYGNPFASYFRGVVALGPDTQSFLPVASSPSDNTSRTSSSNQNDNATHLSSINPQDAVHVGAGPAASPSRTPRGDESHHHTTAPSSTAVTPLTTNVRSRKAGKMSPKNRRHHQHHHPSPHRKGRRHKRASDPYDDHRHHHGSSIASNDSQDSQDHEHAKKLMCCRDRNMVRSTLSCMNLVARALLWSSVVALAAAVVWYSYELKNNGKDPHLIAWFSAGAFVLLGFPISLYGIVMHLANYNQPETQSYIVRILWMVPIYSIESWLCLRYKDYAIYIETLRDCYESYVLYSFLQFLIQVLGGEEALILMLKDKSPTRGVHMWGLQWCVKPWLMGQPVRKTYLMTDNDGEPILDSPSETAWSEGNTPSSLPIMATEIVMPAHFATSNAGLTPTNSAGAASGAAGTAGAGGRTKPLKRVHWTSPFFVRCKFGVLQYVLLKFVCSIAIFILERNHLYKEGDFTYKGGYLYICILTNLSQCWALYCLFFFYYATKNELAPIRPVGKFISVKALVFFTWWQSVGIAVLYNMDLIPHYSPDSDRKDILDLGGGPSEPDWSNPLPAEDAMALDELGGNAFWPSHATGAAAATATIVYTPEDVAKGIQDYLICIEMFVAAIVHVFVFPHTEYSTEAVEARARALNQMPNKNWNKRLGRKWKDWDNKSAWSGTTNTSRDSADIELMTLSTPQRNPNYYIGITGNSSSNNNNISGELDLTRSRKDSMDEDDLRIHPMDKLDEANAEQRPLLLEEDDEEEEEVDFNDSNNDHDESVSTVDENDEDDDESDGDEYADEELGTPSPAAVRPVVQKKNFVSALLDSTIPQDLRDNTVGIIKGDYVVERKTLLHHAATSDSYDLFSRFPNRRMSLTTPKSAASAKQGI